MVLQNLPNVSSLYSFVQSIGTVANSEDDSSADSDNGSELQSSDAKAEDPVLRLPAGTSVSEVTQGKKSPEQLTSAKDNSEEGIQLIDDLPSNHAPESPFLDSLIALNIPPPVLVTTELIQGQNESGAAT